MVVIARMVPTDVKGVTVFSYAGPFVSQQWPESTALRLRMSLERRARYDRQQDAQQRALQIAALRVLELGMRHCGHADFLLSDVVSVAGQKPVWPRRQVDFSVSHAQGRVVCAIAHAIRVGIDVEPANAVAPKTVQRLMSLSAGQLPALDAGNATARWTQVEAIVKAAGQGIFRALDIEWQAAGRAHQATLDGVRYWSQPVEVGVHHVVHVAANAADVQIKIVPLLAL
jgi:4'-phosphopantetheinyl transferase